MTTALTSPGTQLEFAEGRSFALTMPYALDGRVTTHPLTARGFASKNCYLLVEGNDALLIDTGFTVQEGQLLSWLDRLVTPETDLAILPVLYQEFQSVCNVVPVVERYGVRRLINAGGAHAAWQATSSDFRPELTDRPGYENKSPFDDVKVLSFPAGTIFALDSDGRRRLELRRPRLRLLATTVWCYDEATETVFTGDSFSYTWRQDERGPWVIDDESADETTADSIYDYLVSTRCWWLRGADVSSVLRDLAEVFESDRRITTIAPAWGCILRGAETVKRHYELMCEAVRAAGSEQRQYVR